MLYLSPWPCPVQGAVEPCWRKSSCPCSEDYDLDGRNKIEKETQVGVDDGCGLRNIEECSSLDFMGTSNATYLTYLWRWGAHHLPEATHSLVGQLNSEKAPT